MVDSHLTLRQSCCQYCHLSGIGQTFSSLLCFTGDEEPCGYILNATSSLNLPEGSLF
jgi:hypothetical protein